MLTERQKKAVAMLYDGEKVQDTAQALGVHRTTIWRWECTRDFRREWNRIDRNLRRKYERRDAMREAQEETFWEEKLKIAEQKLHEESAKITKRPGKAWYKAWNEYEKAMCRGRTLAQLFDAIEGRERKRRKGRRRWE